MTVMKQYTGLMLDIETLSAHPHNALVMSLGAVEFTFRELEDPLISRRRDWGFELRDQLILGREVSESTQAWWAEQPLDAQAALAIASESHPRDVLAGLASFYRDCSVENDEPIEVWAHGVCFDIGNLESLYRQFGGGDIPWQYNAVRDVRTMVRNLPIIAGRLTEEALQGFTPHDPIDDCIKQIMQLWQVWRF